MEATLKLTKEMVEELISETLYKFYGFLYFLIDDLTVDARIDPDDESVRIQVESWVDGALGGEDSLESFILSRLAEKNFTISGPAYVDEDDECEEECDGNCETCGEADGEV